MFPNTFLWPEKPDPAKIFISHIRSLSRGSVYVETVRLSVAVRRSPCDKFRANGKRQCRAEPFVLSPSKNECAIPFLDWGSFYILLGIFRSMMNLGL
mgnify:CR=1 FL=1